MSAPRFPLPLVIFATAIAVGTLVGGAWLLLAPPAIDPPGPRDPITTAELRALRADPTVVAEGRRLFAANCTLCHGVQGQGNTGPNLRDGYWLGGAQLTDLVEVIGNGRPSKGMVAWRFGFKPAQIHALAVFVASLQGSEDGTGKASQGAAQVVDGPEAATTPAAH